MAFSDRKDDFTGITASPSPPPPTPPNYKVPHSHDIEKAEPNPVPQVWTYGTFTLKDKHLSESGSEKEGRERRLGAFNVIVFSLVAALLLVGVFALAGFVLVTTIME
ncbi:hypothetical protein VTL71DRAFT_6315 [Oculimacula yallundae]|uniref:Uncharacterized protein n=1 Tax=Oculimacula yallundae TaxID=86028 RepID=A0ABR4BWM1_9HELO